MNCIRTSPYLREWNAKYVDGELVIIGVRTPEFEFEKVYSNVLKTTHDNYFKTWDNYSNRFWPAKYLIGKDGVV